MSHGYIRCGNFNGRAKSGSSVPNVLFELKEHVSDDFAHVLQKLAWQVDACFGTFVIAPGIAAQLIGPLAHCLSEPMLSKGGCLTGMAAEDLLEACTFSRSTGLPVEIDFE